MLYDMCSQISEMLHLHMRAHTHTEAHRTEAGELIQTHTGLDIPEKQWNH